MKKLLYLGIVLMLVSCGSDESESTLTDKRDGQTYKTVKIGNQVWMAENLNVDKFRNGELIPEAKTNEEWRKAGENRQPAWCYYDNDPENGRYYGKLYNWYAVSDSRGLAPKGLHVPSEAEWLTLIDYLGGKRERDSLRKNSGSWKEGTPNQEQTSRTVGIKMKSTRGWRNDGHYSLNGKNMGNGSNSSGFSGLPGGRRSGFFRDGGTMGGDGEDGYWWNLGDGSSNKIWYRYLRYNDGGVHVNDVHVDSDTQKGMSVRCLRD